MASEKEGLICAQNNIFIEWNKSVNTMNKN